MRNPSLKLAINETALDREKKLQSPVKKDRSRISNPNDHFVWWDLLCMCTSGKKFPAPKFMKLSKQQLPACKKLQNCGSLSVKIDRMDFILIWELN